MLLAAMPRTRPSTPAAQAEPSPLNGRRRVAGRIDAVLAGGVGGAGVREHDQDEGKGVEGAGEALVQFGGDPPAVPVGAPVGRGALASRGIPLPSVIRRATA